MKPAPSEVWIDPEVACGGRINLKSPREQMVDGRRSKRHGYFETHGVWGNASGVLKHFGWVERGGRGGSESGAGLFTLAPDLVVSSREK